MPVITEASNINNFRTTSAKSIKLDTISKLAQYSLEVFLIEGNVYSDNFRDIDDRR